MGPHPAILARPADQVVVSGPPERSQEISSQTTGAVLPASTRKATVLLRPAPDGPAPGLDALARFAHGGPAPGLRLGWSGSRTFSHSGQSAHSG